MIKSIAKIVFTFLFVAYSVVVSAQEDINTNFIYKYNINQNDSNISDTLGQVVYHQSEAIASLLNKDVIININKKSFKGYRIQIFSVSGVYSKDKANKLKAELLMDYPDIQAYIVYNEPYFKVRIGDFVTKLDALYYMQNLLKDYPFAFIVVDDINYPLLDNDKVELDR